MNSGPLAPVDEAATGKDGAVIRVVDDATCEISLAVVLEPVGSLVRVGADQVDVTVPVQICGGNAVGLAVAVQDEVFGEGKGQCVHGVGKQLEYRIMNKEHRMSKDWTLASYRPNRARPPFPHFEFHHSLSDIRYSLILLH